MGLNMRAEDVGPRLATLVVHGALRTEGIIDWTSASFKLVWGPNYVIRLQHPVSGVEVTLPGHVCITPDFVLVDNNLDNLARCVFCRAAGSFCVIMLLAMMSSLASNCG